MIVPPARNAAGRQGFVVGVQKGIIAPRCMLTREGYRTEGRAAAVLVPG